MRRFLILFIFVFAVGDAWTAEKITWDVCSELSYSYAYACSWLGGKMRQKGWKCVQSFSSGQSRQIEHSIWEKNNGKIQMMVWRIDVGKTGYSQMLLGKEKLEKTL